MNAFDMFSRMFSYKKRQNFSIEIKNVAKTVYFHKKRHFAAPLEEIQDIFRENDSWIRRFRIRENMS